MLISDVNVKTVANVDITRESGPFSVSPRGRAKKRGFAWEELFYVYWLLY